MTSTSPDPDRLDGRAAGDGTLRALEFAQIVEQLAGLTAFQPSRDLAGDAAPTADPILVGIWQDQTDEASRLLDDQAQASIGGARDIRAAIDRAGRGGQLAASDLLDIAETCRAAEQLAGRLANWRDRHLAEVRDDLDPAPALRERIERSVDESGEVLDTASSELAAIRKRMRVAQDRVRERLNSMLRSSDMAGVIGEAIVTVRAGRYVIPIRADSKGRVKGIVHDQSASGATLFVEPITVVELNNSWTQAALDATREEERILDELSREIEARAEPLRASVDALARADFWMARARLGQQMDAVRPDVASDAIELLSARHPLLGPSAVPIDVRLGERFGYRALVVTGPNTGGKTVSLKTIGLLALMHQAGLRVPAASGARLPVFGRVMADIGDEQSIAQSLSTFSSHLRNVVRFVDAADERSLVLLDEIGAGTDPTEGSALAMAVLERLLARGAIVAATTHYAELKTFAQEHPLVSNASVAFDVETLRPTYRLEIGLPGKSQAFAIAERLGLPAEILADARSRIAAEHLSMEQTLAAIAQTEEARKAELAEAQREREAAEEARDLARTGVDRARREAAEMLAEARRAADEMLARAEREVAEVRRELTRQRNLAGSRAATARAKDRDAFEQLEARAAQVRSEVRGTAPADELDAEEASTEAAAPQPRVGLWGRSITLGSVGRIVEVSGRTGRLTLETDTSRVVVPADDVEVVPEPISGPAPRDAEADELRRQAAARISPRLDLRGERVEAALEQLSDYLDQALLAGMDEAVILHGAGTGALRRAVREYLADHPRVRGMRPGRREEGGDQATVAQL